VAARSSESAYFIARDNGGNRNLGGQTKSWDNFSSECPSSDFCPLSSDLWLSASNVRRRHLWNPVIRG